MANVYAGELGITTGDRDYVFRPSLLAMSKLGTPEELIGILRDVQFEGSYATFPYSAHRAYDLALSLLHVCHVGEDDRGLDRLIGCYREVKGRLRYVAGSLPFRDIHVLGARLAVNGMVGAPRKTKSGGKPSNRFDPAEFVAAAQAHLGLSTADAWQMTMIEFQRAIEAKYPPSEAEKKEVEAPTREEAEATVAYIEQFRKRKLATDKK
ncbi:DUF6246 family protein [Phytohalomonas tamaricis]|uniref:DUF6246 family protein n=1 Tax=Phytohalomonas tamaricis TaxID=2081032 RepID=UPI000D0B9858|nr:DUF6246 family protein [Phytohalomonas tamaricis]